MKYTLILAMALFIQSSYAEWKEISFRKSKEIVYVPKNLKEKPKLIINLHGCVQKPEDMQNKEGFEEIAEQKNIIVVFPRVPNGGKYLGCWDYYDVDHQRNNRDNQHLIELTQELITRYKIELDKIILMGLSSGGGQAITLACLAPDYFQKIALIASPVLGSSVNDLSKNPKSAQEITNQCEKLSAQSNLEDTLKSNLKVSMIFSQKDRILNPKQSLTTYESLKQLINTDNETELNLGSLGGKNTKGYGRVSYKEDIARISIIMNEDMGHNYPAGFGENDSKFITSQSVLYTKYLIDFFKF